MDPNRRAGIAFEPVRHNISGLPATAPLKDWNIVEGTHIYDGPVGIFIAPEAKFTVLRRNAVSVDGEAIVNEAATTVLGK